MRTRYAKRIDIVRQSSRQRGFTLIEVMFAMIVFLMMILVFAAVFPFAITASRYSNNYQQAAMITQHKIDQLRELGYSNLVASSTSFSSTKLTSLNIADSCTQSGSGATAKYTCAFTNVDSVADSGGNSGYFPAGSTGTFILQFDNKNNNDLYTNAGNDTSTGLPNAVNVFVTVSWTGGGVPTGSYTNSAKIIQMSHN